MRKSIFLLLILLIACSPVSTSTPTSTPIPPTTTATPSPTETPSHTPTPEGFQISEDGNVQVFEDGKWVDLKPSEGIWGPVDGTKVILVDDGEGNREAFTQMKLDAGFKDGADGDDLVNVAKFSEKTKEWEVIDFSVARLPQELKGIDTRGYWIKTPDEAREISYAGAAVGLLGLKVDGDIVTVLVLHKNRVIKVSIDEIGVVDFSKNRSPESVIPKALTPGQIVEMMRIIQKEKPPVLTDVRFNLGWEFVSPGTEIEGCNNRLGLPSSPEFIAWCKEQILKGEERKLPTKAEVEQAIMFSDASLRVDDNFSVASPGDLWDMVKELAKIEGGWLRFSIIEHR